VAADYRAIRPKVERKLAHLLRRRHGGRRAGVRVGQDFKLLAEAVNLARFAAVGLRSTASGWRLQPAYWPPVVPGPTALNPHNTSKPSENSSHLERALQ
jgi:hypothetical protein